jgi:O-antigen/teichoic acid export membrane protein
VLYSTAAVTGLTAILAAVVIVARSPLLTVIYGSSYVAASGALALQAIAMVFYAGFTTLTVAAIGWGWPRLSVVGICVAAIVEVISLVALPGKGLTTAAGASALSIAVAFGVVLIWGAIRGPAQLDMGNSDPAIA